MAFVVLRQVENKFCTAKFYFTDIYIILFEIGQYGTGNRVSQRDTQCYVYPNVIITLTYTKQYQMKYSYTLEDVNGAGQMFDVLQNGNKRFRIFKSNLKDVFKASGVSLDNLGHGQTVQLSERHLTLESMLSY